MNTILTNLKQLLIGKSRDLSDSNLFHKVSLIAVFAWVGLGADGLSSACYGPEETFKALQAHPALSVFVGLASALTILIICASYSQIIELFPAGGGGYLVASKLLSPTAGVVSGCALLIDYVLTISISIASGADALFSLLPDWMHTLKLGVALFGVVVLTIINLRGVRESVLMLAPVFFLFLATHAFVILYAFISHASGFSGMVTDTVAGVKSAHSEIGMMGMLLLLLRAYSMGAGTYTGIEAVSNGLPILREPRVETGKRTMRYMGFSLALTATGLLLAYLLYHVTPQPGKTLNAVLFESVTQHWGRAGFVFVLVSLASEAALLFIAAQAGFLDGPRVLAGMALDRWFPARFATLSDRFVTQNGILLMSGAALLVMYFTKGSVELLLVLYSINVFITFSLSQLGMVRHWWRNRGTVAAWRRKLAINGVGLSLTLFILISLTVVKFFEGGWITLLLTAALVGLAFLIKRHYQRTVVDLRRLDELLTGTLQAPPVPAPVPVKRSASAASAKTAVVMVNGYNGLGMHTLLGVIRMFPGVFERFVFVQVGVVDAGNFKGAAELANLTEHTQREVDRYAEYARQHGFEAEGITTVGTDVIEEVRELAPKILERHPQAVFFGGQLVFREESWLTRLLHNYSVFALQRQFYRMGFPFLILPVRV